MEKFPRRVGFWIRAAAAAIDLVLITIAYVIAASIIYFIQSKFALNMFGDDDDRIIVVAFILVIMCLSFEIFLAATPAKLILGLCVASANGAPAPRSMRVHRWMTKSWCFWLIAASAYSENVALNLFGSISYTLFLVGCFAAANDYRQAWHDEIAGTAVFRRRDIYGPRPTARGFDMVPPPLPPQD